MIIFIISFSVFRGSFPPSLHLGSAFSSSGSIGASTVTLFSRIGKKTFSYNLPISILLLQWAMEYRKGSKRVDKLTNDMSSASTLFSSWRKISLIYRGIPLLVSDSSTKSLLMIFVNHSRSYIKQVILVLKGLTCLRYWLVLMKRKTELNWNLRNIRYLSIL